MNRKRLFVFSLMVLVSLLTGCFQFQPGLLLNQRPENLDKEFQMGRYVPKIDNFFIILDASTSMSVSYEYEGGESKFNVAKDFIKRMNNTMPEMNVNGSLLTFGRGIELPARQTETVYGLTTYSRSDLEQSLNNLSFPAEGNSPGGRAIKAVSDTIGSVRGDNAVIFISDGEHLEGDPRGRVRVMENRYGERTCFYTVWIGNNPEGKAFMEELAGEIECGFSISVEETVTGEEMSSFVKQVFLTTDTGRERDLDRDSDGDGVLDSVDRCPGTPVGVEVDRFGCPEVKRMDSDGDGVYDDNDNCPDTPVGVEVDRFGCPKISQIDSDGDGVYDNSDECQGTPAGAIVDERGCWVVKGVQFDYKKWDVKPQYNSNLDNIESILKINPGLNVRIEGHTDDVGSMKYNIGLSGKRAQAIKDYLVDKGIDPSRITTTGLGYARPIADNDTPEGRALNRRAEIIPVK
jgi:OOP family OmpA-OmpF porin